MPNAAYAEPVVIESWLANRGVGIGSSDAAAVLGLNPYKTPLEVYVEKTDPLPRTGNLPDNAAMRAGLILEPAIARWYEIETGVATSEPEPATHAVYPFIGATADRLAFTSGQVRIVELKTASQYTESRWGEPGTDAIPQEYLCQVQHQMAVYDVDRADVAVLIAGSDFRIYTVERSDEFIASMLEVEVDFWAMVERREPPEPDWSHAMTPQLIARLHKPRPNTTIILPDETLPIIGAMQSAKAQIKELTQAAELAKARVIHAMGDAEQAEVGGYTITRKAVKRSSYTVKETEYVDFRVKAPKGEM